jgi:hypothetical protein
MTDSPLSLAFYRRAVGLYPRRFREEYGADLVLLFASQLRDESTWRVAARSAVDLALTVPTRHLEARMNRPPNAFVPLLFAAVALSSLVVGLMIGHPIVLALCLVVGGMAGVLALVAARRARVPSEPAPATAHWWKLLASGAGLMAALIAVTTATGELPDNGWLVAMITGLTSIVLMSLGVVLGLTHLAGRPGRRAAA